MIRRSVRTRPGAGAPRRGPGRPPGSGKGDDPGPRERLLRSAAALFASRGIAAVGLDELTAHAGVARNSLYHHFESKDGLVAAYLNDCHDRWLGWMKSEAAKRADPRARLLSVFETLSEWHRTDEYHGCPFVRAAGELGVGVGRVKAAMDAHTGATTAWLESLAAEASQPRPGELARGLLILINGSNLCAARGGNNLRSAETARSIAETMLV